MKDKKVFNNLFDSVCVTLLLFACLAFYLIIIWFGVLNVREEANTVVTMIIATLFFGVMSTITTVLIIIGCYEYWFLSDEYIYSKKIFRKKVTIKLSEIDKVEKKIVPAIVLGVYKSEAYIIYSKNKRISILTNGKKNSDLDSELSKFTNRSL